MKPYTISEFFFKILVGFLIVVIVAGTIYIITNI
jgi:hypothetical protein